MVAKSQSGFAPPAARSIADRLPEACLQKRGRKQHWTFERKAELIYQYWCIGRDLQNRDPQRRWPGTSKIAKEMISRKTIVGYSAPSLRVLIHNANRDRNAALSATVRLAKEGSKRDQAMLWLYDLGEKPVPK